MITRRDLTVGRRQNLARQIGRRRVRDRIVRVDDVELLARATWTILLASDSRYWGSRNSGYVGVSTRWNDSPG